MYMKLSTIITLVLLCVGTMTLNAQVKFKKGETKELYAEAKKDNKLVFIDLFATWCPPCKMMDRDVFSRKDVGDYMDKNFVSAKYSIDEGIGRELAQQYNVRSIPTYIILDETGKVIGRMVGGMSNSDFISKMKAFKDSANK